MPQNRVVNDRYEIGELIGRGGMADVYMGRDIRLGRQVAVKMMRPDLARDPQFQSRFRREAQSSAALNHPNIVAVFDTGEEEITTSEHSPKVSCPFIVMEYVSGQTLRDKMKTEEISIEMAVAWIQQVLAALSYSHNAGIVHRDIKPSNIMVTETGDVKVMDFGIARALSDSSATLTQTQAVVGTAQYLSPEQARGEQVDSRSDLYSTGCVLFELLTGQPPFTGDSAVSVAYQHVREEPPVASSLNPEVSAALDSVLAKALAKDREDRFATGADFSAALENAHVHGVAVGVGASTDAATTVIDTTDAPTPTAATQVYTPGLAAAAGLAAGAAAAGAGAAAAGLAEADEAYAADQADPTDQTDPTYPYPISEATEPLQAESYGEFDNSYQDDQRGYYLSEPDPADDFFTDEDDEGSGKEKSSNKAVWISLIVLVLLGAAVVGGYVWYQNYQEQQRLASEVTVPSVVGMSADEAQNTLTNAGLRPVIAEEHSDEVAKDLAIGTRPGAGEILQEYDQITLIISKGPSRVEIPTDLAGVSEATARDTLERLGLNVGAVSTVNSATVPRDRLVSTDPALGSTIAYGSSVTLYLSTGQVQVPQLIGRTEAEARTLLEAEDVGLQVAVETQQTDAAEPGTVTAQSVQGGSTVDQGATITITIAEAVPEPTPEPTPEDPQPTDEGEDGGGEPAEEAAGAVDVFG